jgi:hypothetical protein
MEQSTHCRHGHEYTLETSYVTHDGHRECRECRRVAHRRDYCAAVPVTGTPTTRTLASVRTHCAKGHPATVESTRVEKDGGRTCRVCAREAMRRYAATPKGLAAITAYRERERSGRPPRSPRTHCSFGHSLDDAYVSNGRRSCRTCQRAAYQLKWPFGKPRKPRATHCKNGHPIDDAYFSKGRRKGCRTCILEAYRRAHPLPGRLGARPEARAGARGRVAA